MVELKNLFEHGVLVISHLLDCHIEVSVDDDVSAGRLYIF